MMPLNTATPPRRCRLAWSSRVTISLGSALDIRTLQRPFDASIHETHGTHLSVEIFQHEIRQHCDMSRIDHVVMGSLAGNSMILICWYVANGSAGCVEQPCSN